METTSRVFCIGILEVYSDISDMVYQETLEQYINLSDEWNFNDF